VNLVIGLSEKRIVRFAVGSPEFPSSFTWRLWTRGNDTYLAFAAIPDPKFSMHGSIWKADFGHKRYIFGPVACASAPGWTQGPAVLFCHVPFHPAPPPQDLLEESSRRRGIRWFPLPPEWHLAEFVVFFARPELGPDALPPPDRTVGPDVCAIGPLPLNDGRHVWLRHLTKPIPNDRRSYLFAVKASLAGLRVDKPSDTLRSLGILMHLHESTIVAVPFGKEIIGNADADPQDA